MCILRPRPASRLNSSRGASAQDERPSKSSADSIPPPDRLEAEEMSRIAAKVGARPLHDAEADAASATRERDATS